MEIDETFLSLEEIKRTLEAEGFTYKISFDGNEIEEDGETEEDNKTENGIEISEKGEDGKIFGKGKKTDFSTDADPEEIRKWEMELPDIEENEKEEDEKEENEGEDDEREENEGGENEKQCLEKHPLKSIDNATVIFFDVFKKKSYTKTFIFQKEGENDNSLYRLVGFCEAPMA